jgi:hypothetical protein
VVVGLVPSLRFFADGTPLRDAAHVKLLERLHGTLASSLRWRTEVPLNVTADRRAWDAEIAGSGWRIVVEAETRLHDAQALERRVALKRRD